MVQFLFQRTVGLIYTIRMLFMVSVKINSIGEGCFGSNEGIIYIFDYPGKKQGGSLMVVKGYSSILTFS